MYMLIFGKNLIYTAFSVCWIISTLCAYVRAPRMTTVRAVHSTPKSGDRVTKRNVSNTKFVLDIGWYVCTNPNGDLVMGEEKNKF